MAAPTILFDLDGTLVDSAPDLTHALNAALASVEAAPISLDHVRRLVGRGARVLIARGLAAQGMNGSEDELDVLLARFLDHYAAHIADESQVFPGVVPALDRLRQRGCRFAVCTNKYESLSVKLLDALGLTDQFEIIAGSDSVSARKPDARHLTETLARMGADPANAIMVGDSVSDVDAARNAGLPVIGVTFGYTDTPIAELEPDIVINHFDDLEQAVEQLISLEAAA